MGKKKHDAAQTETEAGTETPASGDRPEISAAAPVSGAAGAAEPADGQPAGEPTQPDDGARAGADGNDILVADTILKGEGNGEAATQVSENQQDPAAPGAGDPDGGGPAGPLDAWEPARANISSAIKAKADREANVDLGDGSAAGADESEAEADHVLTNWLGDIFAELPSRFNAAVAGEVYRSRSFPISGFAAAAAALVPYYLPDMKIDPIFSHAEAETMAAFVRDHPDAPLLAMWKQVELKHKLPATIPNNADMLALTIFHNACQAVLAYEKAEAADQAEREARGDQQTFWPGDQALQVQTGGFEATGFTPR